MAHISLSFRLDLLFASTKMFNAHTHILHPLTIFCVGLSYVCFNQDSLYSVLYDLFPTLLLQTSYAVDAEAL